MNDPTKNDRQDLLCETRDLAIGYGDVGYGLAVFEDDGTAFNYEVVHCSSLR